MAELKVNSLVCNYINGVLPTNLGGGSTIGNVGQATTINGSNVSFVGLPATITQLTTIPAPVKGLTQIATITMTSEFGALTAPSTPLAWFRLSYPWKILGVRGSLYTASTSGNVTVDIRTSASGSGVPTSSGSGTSIFTTVLTIEATKFCNVSNATISNALTVAANTTGLADDTGISLFCTGAGTGATGLKVTIFYTTF